MSCSSGSFVRAGRAVGAVALCAVLSFPGSGLAQNQADSWTVGGGIGYLVFNKDAGLDGGMQTTLRVTRNFNRWISLEAMYYLAQNLDGNDGGPVPEVIESWTACVGVDALLHLVQVEGSHLDPYVAAGVGVNWFDDEVKNDNLEGTLRLGGGINVHLNEMWLARLDVRFFLPTYRTETSYTMDVGVGFSFGAPPASLSGEYGRSASSWDDRVAPVAPAAVKPVELPASPAIVTPALGPSAGETVLEPQVRFAAASDKIDPRYFSELDKVADALKASPGATAVVEGHADKTKGSDAAYNRKLSQARAQSVVNYLVTVHGISRSRLSAVGVGFDRPKFPNDPVKGNAANRRIEVHITGK